MVVQHNMQAVNANRMLNITTGAQSKSTEKLSSGYRINRAADDAAGLAISEKMRKQLRGLDQASTNAEDGVSAVQTAEGALNEVQSMLQRMNELSVQAANGTNSDSDRDAIQSEIDQLTTEIDRVAETTKFNETMLLKGANGTKTVYLKGHDGGVVGTDSAYISFVDGSTKATLTVKLEVGKTVTVAGQVYKIKSAEDGTSAPDSLSFVQQSIASGANDTVTIDGTTYTKIENPTADNPEYVYDAGTGSTYQFAELAEMVADGTKVILNSTSSDDEYTVWDYTDEQHALTADQVAEKIRTALVQANNIGADVYSTAAAATSDDDQNYTFTINKGTVNVANDLSFNLHVGSDADMSNKITVQLQAMSAAGLGIKNLNVSDDSGVAATYAIDAIADALETVSAQRSALGAIQNRLEHTIDNLDNVVENTTSAESRIRDTDMAEEMVTYSKNNILAQAGQSMLAQANQSTQGVLSLLQ
ncbi:MAG: flagellar hook protein [Lachnospiraceae bacterium]|jgi:flagellin|nr:flagellar hook protein [Lachnospiraceae bacterium]